jgi:hypothetical protein
MKACALMASGELNFNSLIEISRFMTALKYLNSELTTEDIWFIANECVLGSVEEEEPKDN